jgi:hypothetical protein
MCGLGLYHFMLDCQEWKLSVVWPRICQHGLLFRFGAAKRKIRNSILIKRYHSKYADGTQLASNDHWSWDGHFSARSDRFDLFFLNMRGGHEVKWSISDRLSAFWSKSFWIDCKSAHFCPNFRQICSFLSKFSCFSEEILSSSLHEKLSKIWKFYSYCRGRSLLHTRIRSDVDIGGPKANVSPITKWSSTNLLSFSFPVVWEKRFIALPPNSLCFLTVNGLFTWCTPTPCQDYLRQVKFIVAFLSFWSIIYGRTGISATPCPNKPVTTCRLHAEHLGVLFQTRAFPWWKSDNFEIRIQWSWD